MILKMRYAPQVIYVLGAFLFSHLPSTSVQDIDGFSSKPDKKQWIIPERPENSVPERLLVGEWRKFDCRLNRNEVNATLWQEKWNNEFKRIPDGKRTKVLDKNVFFISPLKRSDTGRYYCRACCGLKKLVDRLSISVEGEAFAKPNVSKFPKTQISTYGSSLRLVCDVNSFYDIKWFKDGSKLDGTEVQNAGTIKRSIVVIPSVSEKDNGIYECVIKRSIINYNASAKIVVTSEVKKSPSFLEFNATSQVILKEKDPIFVHYSAIGTPQPEIAWFKSKNGLLLEQIATCPPKQISCSNLNRRRQEKITRNVFKILEVEYPADDNITYTCQLTNFMGNTTNSFTIKVYTKPKLKEDKQRNLIYRKEMKLKCVVEKVNPKMVSFIWQYCDPQHSLCHPKDDEAMWKPIHAADSDLTTKIVNLSTSLLLPDQPQNRMFYRCIAKNILGTDQMSFQIIKYQGPSSTKSGTSIIFLSTIIPVGVVTLAVIFVFSLVMYKRMKLYGGLYLFSYPPLRDYIDQLDSSKDIREQLHKLPLIPEWEFPKEKVSLHSELGRGEFGSVWLAHANRISEFRPRDILKQKTSRSRLSILIRTLRSRNNNYVIGKEVTPVAVKKMKDDFNRGKLVDLQSELKILIHVGEHENIVNLLGACTKGMNNDLWIILEYCPNGDLRSFVQNGRYRYDQHETSLAVDLSVKLGPRNLVYIAFQIAKGMEFLISRKVIHRDLAARNVLLGPGYVAKVADFGLARDVYKYQKYVKKSCTLLPLKWMAIESIENSVFTEKTDVWSFGVVLWELFTFGQTPYPGISNLDVFTYLVEGQRMAIPTCCPSRISVLMTQCWKKNPDKRPSFVTMVKLLDDYVATEENFQTKSQNNSEKSDFPKLETFPCEEDLNQPEGYLQVIFVDDDQDHKKTKSQI